jgi:hypothetical protein
MPEEFISRTEALKDFESCHAENPYWTPQRVKTLLIRQPAADVAEVVRCASCKYVRPTVNAHTGEQVGIWCCLHDVLNVGPDDYCSRGEKKGATE